MQKLNLLARVEVGLRIAAKLLLLSPLLVGMMLVSLTVDPAGIYHPPEVVVLEQEGEEEPREITLATALLAGYNLADYSRLDERGFLAQYVEELEEAPGTIALGSSRVLQLRKEAVGAESFYNCGMSGSDIRDILNSFYLFDRAGKLPENMIIALDSWLFNPSERAYSPYSDEDLYNEFLGYCLGVDNGWVLPEEEPEEEEPVEEETHQSLAPLLDPSYFQGSLQEWWKNLFREEEPEPEPEPEEETEQDDAPKLSDVINTFPIVRGDASSQPEDIKLADGSVVYGKPYRIADEDELEWRARDHAATFHGMQGFEALDEELMDIFTRFITYAQGQGVNIIFVLVPHHPLVYTYATENKYDFQGFFAAERWYASFAEKMGIPLYGSYNPFVAGSYTEDFYDGLHITEEALALILPDIETIKAQQAEGTAGSAWTHGETRVSYERAAEEVARLQGVQEPEILKRGDDLEINGEPCYRILRYNNSGEDAILMAQYAATTDECVIYRLETQENTWVVDSLF